MTEIKICGVTTIEDALYCVDVGVHAIGLNFWRRSPRSVDLATAKRIVRAVENRVETVGVFVDAATPEIREIVRETGIQWVQLHGGETPDQVEALLPNAYKAIGVQDGGAVALARTYPGDRLLLDASVPGLPGGTGRTFDWTIAAKVARERELTLAGGLNPQNVRAAIASVQPFRVDVASGVEHQPGRKDRARIDAFVAEVEAAFSGR